MATMIDVAAAAGVSVATVSRALADTPRLVSERTRERVRRAAAEVGYHPNRLARNMRSGSTRLFGLVVSDVENPFFTSILRGVEDIAQKEGYAVVLMNTDENPTRETACLDVLAAERASGVIVASTNKALGALRNLASMAIPIVAIDRRIEGLSCDTVVVDNASAAHQAVDHLIRLGHTRIAMISGPVALSPACERFEGYERALQENHIGLDQDLIAQGDLREDSGYKTALALLRQPDRPTAMFAVNNLTTLGALRAIHELGLRIPQDVSVVGFDDLQIGELLGPGLTVVRQPSYKLGYTAGQLLVQRQSEPDAPIREISLGAEFTIRGSTAEPHE